MKAYRSFIISYCDGSRSSTPGYRSPRYKFENWTESDCAYVNGGVPRGTVPRGTGTRSVTVMVRIRVESALQASWELQLSRSVMVCCIEYRAISAVAYTHERYSIRTQHSTLRHSVSWGRMKDAFHHPKGVTMYRKVCTWNIYFSLSPVKIKT